MKVHYTTDALPAFKNAVITTGTFDGVHRGHQQLIQRIRELSREIDGESVLITFDPHPRTIVFPEEKSVYLLSTLKEKISRLESFGVDHLVVVPFTKEFSKLEARDYIEKFLVEKFHPAVIVIGYNHQFGHHRDGNIELLKKFSAQNNFRVQEITKQLVDDIEVSSTRIRIALQEGDAITAAHLLGYPYSLEGRVVKGDQLGRTLGFPTANVAPDNAHKLIPADGIYAVNAFIESNGASILKHGVLSIGMRPTVSGKHRTIEVFLFDFDQDIYDEAIRVDFLEWIREEKKFDSLQELKDAIAGDVIRAKAIHKKFQAR